MLSPRQSHPMMSTSGIDTPEFQRVMLQHNLVAVTNDSTTVVRSDFKDNSMLLRHLSKFSSTRHPMLVGQPIGGGGGGTFPSPTPSPDSLSSCLATAQVGDTCGGMKVIASLTAGTNLMSSSLDGFSDGFDSCAGAFAPTGGPWCSGVIYTIERIASCLEADISNVETDLTKVASEIVGGALWTYISSGALSYVLSSGKGLIAGTVSAWAFWDVLAAATTAVTLPELLGAAGVSLSIGTAFEVARCSIQG